AELFSHATTHQQGDYVEKDLFMSHFLSKWNLLLAPVEKALMGISEQTSLNPPRQTYTQFCPNAKRLVESYYSSEQKLYAWIIQNQYQYSRQQLAYFTHYLVTICSELRKFNEEIEKLGEDIDNTRCVREP